MDQSIVICSANRTPLGQFQGVLAPVSAPQLGGYAIKAALADAQLKPDQLDEVLMGCVLPAGLGQAPARQAAFHAGLPESVPATTLNKMCGSGMKAVMIAHDAIKAGSVEIAVAGGMESMTNAPYLLPQARLGYRLGHNKVLDHMFLDGLEDAYDKGQLMGIFAESCAEKYSISRKVQDAFACESVRRAQVAQSKDLFAAEIAPVNVTTRKTTVTVDQDEGPQVANIDKIPTLKPAFKKDGTVTAANSSSISDGAAALVLMNAAKARALGLTPLAKIVAQQAHAQAPSWFTTAPIKAIEGVLAKAGWSMNDVDLFEINEAFAVVTLAAMQALKLPHEKVNIHGGACVLGHPLGATGARIMVTLIHALKARGLKRGIAALCIGGGEATAVAVELS